MIKTMFFCFILVVCFCVLFTDFGFSLAFHGVGEALGSLFSFADSIGR